MDVNQLENKVRQDAARVKDDLSTLAEDSAARFGSYEGNISQAIGKTKEKVTSLVEDGVSQLSEGFEKLTGDAKETVANAAMTVKKEVGEGLVQYNEKAQEVAKKVSPELSSKAARYPWVSISIALLLGFMLGGLFIRPIRRSLR